MSGNVPPGGTPAPADALAAKPRPVVNLLWFALPLLALLLASAWLVTGDWLKAFDAGAPPVEKLTF